MASFNLTADGSTSWMRVNDNLGVKVSLANDFGSGTVTVKQKVNETERDALSSGSAITYTAAADDILDFRTGDEIRFTLASSTSPDLDITVTGSAEVI